MLSWRLKGQRACLPGLRSQALAPMRTARGWTTADGLLEGVWGPRAWRLSVVNSSLTPGFLEKQTLRANPELLVHLHIQVLEVLF